MDIGTIYNISVPFHSFHINYLCSRVIELIYKWCHVGDYETLLCLKYYTELLQSPGELT